ncbi:hypothetical protein CCP1ISM_60001 [Azospirillaceae bacterium]
MKQSTFKMRRIIETNIKNLIPRKERRLINIDLPLQNEEPILVDKRGRRWFIIIDGHHRYYKLLEENKQNILIKVRREDG